MVNKAGKDGKPDGRANLGRRRQEALFTAVPPLADLPADYAEALNEIKIRIQQERLRVVLAANSAMTLLYWDIGQKILKKQAQAGWELKS